MHDRDALSFQIVGKSRKANVLRCVTALDAVLRRNGFEVPAGAGVDAVYRAYGDDG